MLVAVLFAVVVVVVENVAVVVGAVVVVGTVVVVADADAVAVVEVRRKVVAGKCVAVGVGGCMKLLAVQKVVVGQLQSIVGVETGW